MENCAGIRELLAQKLEAEDFVTDKSGVKTIELIGTSFRANQPAIFGEPNQDYIDREIRWYQAQSLRVADIPGGPPEIWKQVASAEGYINSNYGWAIWHRDNCSQYVYCRNALLYSSDTRRAIMIYTRPSMQLDYNFNGMSDFMCTNTVQYVIREGKLNAIVNMRSNDVVFGYRNDWAWQKYVLNQLWMDLTQAYPDLQVGDIFWQVGSLHIYERHFYMVDFYRQYGKHDVKLKEYESFSPNSRWSPRATA